MAALVHQAESGQIYPVIGGWRGEPELSPEIVQETLVDP
jgi:hypothetical protein